MTNRFLTIEVTEIGSGRRWTVRLPVGTGTWSVGRPGTGADLELDEPGLAENRLWIHGASNHLILECRFEVASTLPKFLHGHRADRHGVDPLAWARIEENRLSFRFDYEPLQIGQHVIHAQSDLGRTGARTDPPPTPSTPWWKFWA